MTATGQSVEAVFQQALGLHRAGRLDEARRLYERTLELQPQEARALHPLGIIAAKRIVPSRPWIFFPKPSRSHRHSRRSTMISATAVSRIARSANRSGSTPPALPRQAAVSLVNKALASCSRSARSGDDRRTNWSVNSRMSIARVAETRASSGFARRAFFREPDCARPPPPTPLDRTSPRSENSAYRP